MKGEYPENQDDNHHHHHHHNHNPHSHSQSQSHHNLFSKFPPPHLHNQPPKFQQQPQHYHHPFPLKDSEEAESAAATTTAITTTNNPPSSKKPKTTTATTTSEDGATIEVSRRPRGRPPGSKNKPKPPIVITRDPEPAMSPYILEVPGGSDIVDSLTRFTRRRGIGLCVLTASGAVANVSLKQPSTAAPGGTVTFHGRFDILSLSAVLLLQTVPFSGSNNSNGFTFTISLAGPQGQIVGGKVVGPLLASGTVYIIAASFNNPSYFRLPVEDQEAQNPSGGGGDRQSSSPVSGGGDGGGSSGGGGGNMGMYSCHMGTSPSEVLWAPTARPPPPF